MAAQTWRHAAGLAVECRARAAATGGAAATRAGPATGAHAAASYWLPREGSCDDECSAWLDLGPHSARNANACADSHLGSWPVARHCRRFCGLAAGSKW